MRKDTFKTKLEEMNKVIDSISSLDDTIITFPEIKISPQQLRIVSKHFFGLDYAEMVGYYKNKVHGNILISDSVLTTREDQPDFQYIFDLGIKALEKGMHLEGK